MATEADIQRHNRVIENFIKNFDREIRVLLDDIFLQISRLGPSVTRSEILALFAPVRQFLGTNVSLLDQVINSNISLNSSVINLPVDNQTFSTIAQLKSETLSSITSQLESEQQKIIQVLVIASIAGLAISPLLSQIRIELKKASKRLRDAYSFFVRNFDSSFTLLRAKLAGIDNFVYVGVNSPKSRSFCQFHKNKVYTADQINKIWRTATWGGKAPGNPFVVRGGYNCRHWFLPVKK